MIVVTDKKDCCGCNACSDICPKHAICFEPDHEGFLYPTVDKTRCVNCGLCNKICPVQTGKALDPDQSAEKVSAYAVVNNDFNVRIDSTSGGLFSALAEMVFADGGFVGGAVWNDDFSISHILADSKESLARLRSSKYAQSNATGFYLAVKKALATNRRVLVCGTPCQVSALKRFLGKPSENLILLDFICRGINSPLAMRKYIDHFEAKKGSRIIAIKQKNKELGWHRLTTKLTFENGDVVYDARDKSLFMRGYLISNLLCRPSCYDCRFKGLPFASDITLADCWGAVKGLSSEFNNDLGTSLAICNTSKGRACLKALEKIVSCEPLKMSDVVAGNQMILRSLDTPPFDRSAFYEMLSKFGLEESLHDILYRCEAKERMLSRKVKRSLKRICRTFGCWFSIIRINGIWAFLSGQPIIIPHGRLNIRAHKDAKLIVRSDTHIGESDSSCSHIVLKPNARLEFNGGVILGSGSISVENNATLRVGANVSIGKRVTIKCHHRIDLGDESTICDDVSIFDSVGTFYFNNHSVLSNDPINIGQHVLIQDGCVITPGTIIGGGSIVEPFSLTRGTYGANKRIVGNPAVVISSDQFWK